MTASTFVVRKCHIVLSPPIQHVPTFAILVHEQAWETLCERTAYAEWRDSMRNLLYVILGLGVFCATVKLAVNGMYRKLIREAGQMGKSKHPLMKILLKKFEACYQLKMGVENVEIFADKYLNAYKKAGIHLYTWEILSDASFGVTLLASILANLYIVGRGDDRRTVLVFLLAGITVCGLILLEDMILNLRFKRRLLMVEILDYLENVYKPRLENQVFHSEEMEEYHREYFEEERAQLDELLSMKQAEEPPVKIQFTKEEEAIIEEVLKEYIV